MTITTQLTPTPQQQFVDANGVPYVNGQVWTYAAGTTTPQATYTDSSGAFLLPNPVVLDAAGRASIWLDATLVYKFVVQDVNSVTVYTVDNIPGTPVNTITPGSIATYAPGLDGTGATGTWNISVTGNSGTTQALDTTGAPVNVSNATPPIAGQALIATNSTHAVWANVATGAGGVTSLNGFSGNVSILAGGNVTITPGSNSLTISSTGGGGGGGGGNWGFVSSPTAITTNVGSTAAHGLGQKPTFYNVTLICVSAQGGYSVGDEMDAQGVELLGGDGGGNGTGCVPTAISFDSTNIYWRIIYPSQATLNYLIGPTKSGGGRFTMTQSSWQVIFRCSVNPGSGATGATGPAGGAGSGAATWAFTTSSSWTCPLGVSQIVVNGTGGGAGGTGATLVGFATYPGAGGGGGERAVDRIVNVTSGTTYSITIGAGGGSASAGGATSISGVLSLAGGSPGLVYENWFNGGGVGNDRVINTGRTSVSLYNPDTMGTIYGTDGGGYGGAAAPSTGSGLSAAANTGGGGSGGLTFPSTGGSGGSGYLTIMTVQNGSSLQTWTDKTSSRDLSTTYTNDTPNKISIAVQVSGTDITAQLKTGTILIGQGSVVGTGSCFVNGDVPAYTTYVLTSSAGTIVSWAELR